MVFCPIGNGHSNTKHSKSKCLEFKPISHEDLSSFAIPLLQTRRFLFAQLSQPVEEETSVCQVAIHSAIRQHNESFMPVRTTTQGEHNSSSALWSGVQWWAVLADHAQKNASFATLWAKIAPPDAMSLALSPPSRFVVSIPAFFGAGEDDEEDEDEGLEESRVEKIVSFLCRLLAISSDEVPRLRRSCRTQHGKLWTTLRSISGGLTLLRFTPAEGHQRSVDLSIQCSDLADLSAVRICYRCSPV